MTPPSVSAVRRRVCVLVSGLLLVSCLCGVVWGDPVEPGALDRHVVRSVCKLLRDEHLSGHPLDDEISQRGMKTLLESLDPWKRYFYQSDVDAFMEHENKLDDEVLDGNVGFVYSVFKVFLQRVDERVKLVDELLAEEHDFTVDEEMVRDRELARYPRTAAEARDTWRRWIKYELLALKADEIEGQEARDKLTRRYHSRAKRAHQTDGEELLEMYLGAMTTSFDPHTSYMSPSTLKNFEIAMRLELDGIGASLRSEDGYTVVYKLVPGGAADRIADKNNRLNPGDKIVGVGQGVDGEIVDCVDMKLKDVVDMIRGKRETVVRLEMVPADDSKRKIINITRDRIELKDSEARGVIFSDGRKSDGQPYKIGVIELPSFYMDMDGYRRGNPNYKSTTRDVRRILDDFNKNGVDALILDLRGNGGGSLTEAINLTGLFIDRGPVVQVQDGQHHVNAYEDRNPGVVWAGPLVVVIDKFSASASEILAGAIQDYGRGLIVGDHATHGKGTVQSLMDLGQKLFQMPYSPTEMGALKVTMQQFYRPNGESTQNRGVLADVELPSLTTHLEVGESDLDYAIDFDEVDPLSYTPAGYVDQAIRDRLRHLSGQRVGNSKDFQDVLKDIAQYKEQKAKKYITLNEEKFLKERAELNAEKEEKERIEKLSDPARPPIERDYYLDEAMAITVDYLNLRHLARVN